MKSEDDKKSRIDANSDSSSFIHVPPRGCGGEQYTIQLNGEQVLYKGSGRGGYYIETESQGEQGGETD